MREPGFRGETSTDRIELVVAQRTDQVASDCDLISITSGQALLRQRVNSAIKCSTDLGAKTGARKLGGVPCDQSPIEPGRPFGCHLLVEAEIRAHRERDPLPSLRIVEPAQFHDAADRTITSHIDIGELEVVDAPIDPINNSKGRAPQFIIQAAGHETADDWFAMGFALERPGRWRASY